MCRRTDSTRSTSWRSVARSLYIGMTTDRFIESEARFIDCGACSLLMRTSAKPHRRSGVAQQILVPCASATEQIVPKKRVYLAIPVQRVSDLTVECYRHHSRFRLHGSTRALVASSVHALDPTCRQRGDEAR
jgi:hypothetical protein